LTTKKRPSGEGEKTAKKTAKRTTKPAAAPAGRTAAKTAPKPRIKSSHAEGGKAGPRRARPTGEGKGTLTPRPRTAAPRTAAPRKAPLAGPKRTAAAKRSLPPPAPEPSSAARELALALAAAGIDKKAVGIEILDVTGKVDYADYLVVMTGRSDRHVNAIATGIDEAMRKRKAPPLSIEGLTGATWVLIDFGDVVVHVFQEDARALYDIEGLWIDASRIPVPNADKAEGAPAKPGE
jgi:ribosome-associated protein